MIRTSFAGAGAERPSIDKMSYQAAAHRQADLLLPHFADKDKFGRPPVVVAAAAAAAAAGEHPTFAVGDKFAAADRGPPSHRKRVWENDREFNIQLSRIATARELLAAASHESMLAYTQRVAESRRNRGFHIPPPAIGSGGVPVRADAVDLSSLLVRATHISRRTVAGRHGVADGSGTRSPVATSVSGLLRRSSVDAGGAFKSKSLPNMKLEPLLGSRERYKLGLSDADRLKDLLGLRHVSDRQRLPRVANGARAAPATSSVRSSAAPDGSDAAAPVPPTAASVLQACALPPIAPQPVGSAGRSNDRDGDAPPDAAAATTSGTSAKRRQLPLDSTLLSKSGLNPRADRSDEAGHAQDAAAAGRLERGLVNEPIVKLRSAADATGKEASRNEGELDFGTFAVVAADQPAPRAKGAAASGGTRRPKKPKRMRIVPPNLSSIPEDELEEEDDFTDEETDDAGAADNGDSMVTAALAVEGGEELPHAHDPPHQQQHHHTYRHIALPHILDAIGEVEPSYDEAAAAVAAAAAAAIGARADSIEERRKDTAILRRVNAAATDGSLLQAHQKSMASLAKRKLRRLPPIQGMDGDE